MWPLLFTVITKRFSKQTPLHYGGVLPYQGVKGYQLVKRRNAIEFRTAITDKQFDWGSS